MVDKTRNVAPRRKQELDVDQALIALFIGAMNANKDVARDELARVHHLIWSTRRFRRKSGETVRRLIDRMKRLLEDEDAATVMQRAARVVPAKLRPPVFAVVADLLLADGRIDARERRFLRQLAVDFHMPIRVATNVVDALLVKNRL
jgi:tellurite resistance protein